MVNDAMKLLDIITYIASPRGKWRLFAVRVLARLKREGNTIVSAYMLQKKWEEYCKTDTLTLKHKIRVPSVRSLHAFFDQLVKVGLCKRDEKVEKYGVKKIEITDIIMKLAEILDVDLGNTV